MAGFQITINPEDLRAVNNLMAGIKECVPAVTARAVNRVLSGVKTDASTEITSVMNITKSAADKTFKIRQAVIGGVPGAIASTGAYVPLIDMKGTRQTQTGVSVQVLKENPRKVIRSAFIATMKSGHKGVYRRETRQHSGKMGKMAAAINRSGYVFVPSKNRYIPAAWLPKEYRLPIKQLYTSSVPDIMARAEVMKRILGKAAVRLHDRLFHEMDYELSRHV